MSTATGQFYDSNGQIIDPNGQVYVARGVNVGIDVQVPASQLLADFPGLNFVRLAINTYPTPASIAAYVNSLTSQGIVVELEDHTTSTGSDGGGGVGSVFTGQELTNELNWYSSVASYFKNNPYVWFGTDNEPPGPGAALSTWQQQTYDAIRNTGNTSPIMLEAGISATPMGGPLSSQLTASDYSGMTSVIWDIHSYGWVSNYSTNQSTVSSALATTVQEAHSITSADGTIPVIIGEYGNSTTGVTIDANANQVITAIQSAVENGTVSGSAAWIAHTGAPGDGLLNSNYSLTSYGQQVAAGIAAEAASETPTTPPSSGGGSGGGSGSGSGGGTTTATPSANDTVVTAGSSAAITDASGNTWTIANGVVQENGQAAGYSSGVTELAYVNGTVWQENAAGNWWGWSNGGWNTGNGTSTSPLPTSTPPSSPPPSTTSTITLNVSEDAYQGDAQFIVKVDGTQVGGTMIASALHSSGDSNVFVLTGNWASGSHQVAIQFLNDAYGGTASTDRNLYVNAIAFNGQTESGTSAALYTNSTRTFSVGGSVAAASGPADTVTVHLSEDAYNGNAQFQLLVDGKVVTTPQQVVALHAAGAWEDLTFSGNFGAGNHTIGVQFTNDAYGGTASTDRNLYVNGIDVNGTHYGSGVSALYSNGTATFAIATTH
ncbi:carbohydrate-binding domain-containing protein [Rhodopila globiformis]|uniref:Carbohydrate binding module xylan-binding domain-containing protein n=1 Tax=Rhodopila globiformis TaxID=1071 RepID=A0A2S6MYX3_RHOGL|nr:carbohydrate-binding domain-containing protein [Rhodopila globiformis]PPQ27550.1 hypothetical protein CCS01_26905 [Rhodopila globiformis]